MNHVAEKSTVVVFLLALIFGPFALYYSRDAGWGVAFFCVATVFAAIVSLGIAWVISAIVALVIGISDISKHNEIAIRNRAALNNNNA